MARVTLTPVNLAGTAGLTLPAAGAQSLTGFTGVQFVNNGLLWLAVYVGVAGACNMDQQIGGQVQGQLYPTSPSPFRKALANSTNYLFGPWSAKDFTQLDGSGMTYIDFTVVTGNTVTLYQLVPAP
jgi:hypothetical protein